MYQLTPVQNKTGGTMKLQSLDVFTPKFFYGSQFAWKTETLMILM